MCRIRVLVVLLLLTLASITPPAAAATASLTHAPASTSEPSFSLLDSGSGDPEAGKKTEKATDEISWGFLAYASLAVKYLWNAFYVLGAIIQYYPQWMAIRRGDGDGFSPLVCFILLTANTLRLFYWLGEAFDSVLAWQSVVMVIVQLFVLHALCRHKMRLLTAVAAGSLDGTDLDAVAASTDITDAAAGHDGAIDNKENDVEKDVDTAASSAAAAAATAAAAAAAAFGAGSTSKTHQPPPSPTSAAAAAVALAAADSQCGSGSDVDGGRDQGDATSSAVSSGAFIVGTRARSPAIITQAGGGGGLGNSGGSSSSARGYIHSSSRSSNASVARHGDGGARGGARGSSGIASGSTVVGPSLAARLDASAPPHSDSDDAGHGRMDTRLDSRVNGTGVRDSSDSILPGLDAGFRRGASSTMRAPISIFDAPISAFWRWDPFSSYVVFLLVFVAFLAAASAALLRFPAYVAVLGYAALLIEALLGVPQAYQNCFLGTHGLSAFLIWSWLVGDAVKTVFFISLGAPAPFLLCGVFQVAVDVFILVQIGLDKSVSVRMEREAMAAAAESIRARSFPPNFDPDELDEAGAVDLDALGGSARAAVRAADVRAAQGKGGAGKGVLGREMSVSGSRAGAVTLQGLGTRHEEGMPYRYSGSQGDEDDHDVIDDGGNSNNNYDDDGVGEDDDGITPAAGAGAARSAQAGRDAGSRGKIVYETEMAPIGPKSKPSSLQAKPQQKQYPARSHAEARARAHDATYNTGPRPGGVFATLSPPANALVPMHAHGHGHGHGRRRAGGGDVAADGARAGAVAAGAVGLDLDSPFNDDDDDEDVFLATHAHTRVPTKHFAAGATMPANANGGHNGAAASAAVAAAAAREASDEQKGSGTHISPHSSPLSSPLSPTLSPPASPSALDAAFARAPGARVSAPSRAAAAAAAAATAAATAQAAATAAAQTGPGGAVQAAARRAAAVPRLRPPEENHDE